jgi:hypothetical protein
VTDIALSRPEMQVLGDSLRFTWLDEWVCIEFTNFDDGKGEPTAEFVIGNTLDQGRVIEFGKLNLVSMQTRSTLAKNLNAIDSSFDWHGALKQVSLLAVQHYRAGEPEVDLADHVLESSPRWYLEPYLEREGFTVMYADGGTGKSVMALAMAYTMATGTKIIGRLDAKPAPVMYLDWETGIATQHRRLRAIAAGVGQQIPRNVIYQYMATPLVAQVAHIRRKVVELKVGAIIMDSLGASADGPIEESSTALKLGRAIRDFRVPVLAIHHKPKNTDNKRGAQVMFGSVYFANYCRLAWELNGTFYEGENRTDLKFLNSKNNNGPRVKAHGWTMQFVNDAVFNPVTIKVTPCDIEGVPEFNKERSVESRIVDVLIHGPQKVGEIASQLDANEHTVANTLSRMKSQNKALKVAGEKWGLTVREEVPF